MTNIDVFTYMDALTGYIVSIATRREAGIPFNCAGHVEDGSENLTVHFGEKPEHVFW